MKYPNSFSWFENWPTRRKLVFGGMITFVLVLALAAYSLYTVFQVNAGAAADTNTAVIIIAVLLALTALQLAITVSVTSAKISAPLNDLAKKTKDIAAGDLNVNVAMNRSDEIGSVTQSIQSMVDAVRNLNSQVLRMTEEHNKGETDARINTGDMRGGFKELAQRINGFTDSAVGELGYMTSSLDSLGRGDFRIEAKEFPGKKHAVTQSVKSALNAVRKVSATVEDLAKAGREGRLSCRAELSGLEGDWLKLGEDMNRMLGAIEEPLTETVNVLHKLERGDLNASVSGRYSGAYADISGAIDAMRQNLSVYVTEISEVLGLMSNRNLDVEIKREYHGDFLPIKEALIKIVASLNAVLGEIGSSAAQVAIGARQVTDSGSALSAGATEQNTTVSELSGNLDAVAGEIKDNAANMETVSQTALTAREKAGDGDKEMKVLLDAMEKISDASQNISRIVKVIEDIASQTNLLAINAAVEAAHAGVHGAGFAIVADQVRDLAAKSSESAKETTGLIDATVERISQGMLVARQSAESLEDIVRRVDEISRIAQEVADTSRKQAEQISQINDGLGTVARGIQDTSMAIEESAASAEQLSTQAQIFSKATGSFKLKPAKPGEIPADNFLSAMPLPTPEPLEVTEQKPAAEYRPLPKPTPKPEPKPVPVRTIAKPLAKPEPKPALSPVKPLAAPIKPAAKPLPKPEAKPIPKPAPKPAPKIEAKPAAERKPLPKRDLSPAKPEEKPAPKTEQRSASRKLRDRSPNSPDNYDSPQFGKY